MRSSFFRHFSASTLCALAALAGGVIAGTGTVHGLRENSYGPLDPPKLISGGFDGATADQGSFGGYRSDESDESASIGCHGCSERDLGYRWAALAAVRLPDQCPGDSWGFRRGCLDFVGGV